jgi:hypothetical protein
MAKTKTKKVSKSKSKSKSTKAPKVLENKEATTKSTKTKVQWVTPYDFNPSSQVGSNGTPTKIWSQFPCDSMHQAKIDEYMRERGIKTYAHLAQILIAQALKLA